MTVSIIIAVKTWQKNLSECVAKCRALEYRDFEILILPDEPLNDKEGLSPEGSVPLKVVPTGPVGPARKRDFALPHAKGEILAFIDDDAFPRADWLTNALKNFSDPFVAAVGGPAITPDNDSLHQKASGMVFGSPLVSGNFVYRYIPGKRQEVEDYPSCNFLVRKNIMEQLGGFDTSFWPGEDTKLCLDITKKLGKKIIYDPTVLVWHHRRSLFLPHISQIENYALHRGYFVKKFPQTSLKISYFMPSILVGGIILGGISSLSNMLLRPLYLMGFSLYLIIVCIGSFPWQGRKNFRLWLLIIMGIIATHFTYGVYFIKGLLTTKLAEEK
ncbi:MAG: glycosyltransferase [Candidatus Omnitrophica bacterium]|nr:glycosyltransferase [Candidatus Omnitrophota bacterium]